MKKNMFLMICFLALPLFASAGDKPSLPKACQIWSYTGTWSGGVETGTWNFTEGHNPGTMTGHGSSSWSGGSATYTLTATVTPLHKVFVERKDTSGGQCNYSGFQIGNQISGTYVCSGAAPGNTWSAVVSQC